VVKSEKHPEIRNRYLKLKKRRGHKRAIIAIARMLLTAIYMIRSHKIIKIIAIVPTMFHHPSLNYACPAST